MFKTYQEYYEHLCKLPSELQKIHSQCWDETGHPLVNEPFQLAVNLLLNHHASSNQTAFISDFMQLFPHSNKDVAKLCFSSFLHGAQYIASRLKSSNL